MAWRRAIGSGLAAASGGLDALIKQMFAEDSQRKQAAYVYNRQMDLEDLDHRNQIVRMMMEDPDLADRMFAQGGLPEGMTADSYRRTDAQRMGQITPEILKGNTPQTAVTPDILQALTKAQGLEDRPSIESLLTAAAARSGNIESELQKAEDAKPRMGPGGVSGFQGRSGDFIPTERTAVQEGERELGTFLTGEGSPAWASAEGNKQNTIENLTRAAKAATAGAEGYARESGSIRGRLANKAGLVDLEGSLATARHQAEQAAGSAGAANAMAAPLFVASRQAEEAENSGAFITIGTQVRATSPWGAALMGKASKAPVVGGFFKPNPANNAYTQAAVNYATIVTRIMSGVQSREDERNIFLTNNFMVEGDNEIEGIKAQKQAARRVFDMAVMAAQEGGGARAAGRVVGGALKSGTISAASIAGVTLDPEFAAGMNEGAR